MREEKLVAPFILHQIEDNGETRSHQEILEF